MSISVSKVGHIVLRVRDLEKSLSFYCGVLGLKEVARRDFGQGPIAFLSTGNSHHDVALTEAVDTCRPSQSRLDHFALKVGDSQQELADAKRDLESHGAVVHVALDHRVSQGLYVSDPDGNLIELYVDADEALWRDDPSLVANAEPLTL